MALDDSPVLELDKPFGNCTFWRETRKWFNPNSGSGQALGFRDYYCGGVRMMKCEVSVVAVRSTYALERCSGLDWYLYVLQRLQTGLVRC